MVCTQCGTRCDSAARFCGHCGTRLTERFAEINVNQNIAAGTEGVTGVQLGEVKGDVTMNVFQVSLPPELIAELKAVPTEVQPPNSGDRVTPSRREAVKQSLGEILDAAKRSPEVRAVQMGDVRISRVDLLIKKAVLLKTEAEQMMLDMVTKNKDVVDRAKASSQGREYKLDLADVMRGFDSKTYEAKLKDARQLLEEAVKIDAANTDALLQLVQVRESLEDDQEESRRLLYRVHQLLANPKDDVERFRLAQSTYLSAIMGEFVHPDMLASARAMFDRLGRVDWVRQCDFISQGNRAAAPPATATAQNFPAGQWQVQASNGQTSLVTIRPDGTFFTQGSSYGIAYQAQGDWGLDPQSGLLAFQGLINGMQPFALQIGIQAQQDNGFAGFGNDGMQYFFQRR